MLYDTITLQSQLSIIIMLLSGLSFLCLVLFLAAKKLMASLDLMTNRMADRIGDMGIAIGDLRNAIGDLRDLIEDRLPPQSA